jgi:hypothetical protein
MQSIDCSQMSMGITEKIMQILSDAHLIPSLQMALVNYLRMCSSCKLEKLLGGRLNRQLPQITTMQACEAARTAVHARQPWRHLVLLRQSSQREQLAARHL